LHEYYRVHTKHPAGIWSNEQKQMVQMFCLEVTIKGNIYDPVNIYSYVEDTKVSVSIKKNKCQQMHIERDISI